VDSATWAAWTQVLIAGLGFSFLIYELRQAAKALRLSLYNETKLSWDALNAQVLENRDLTDLLGYDAKTVFVHSFLLHMERTHYLAHEKLVDQSTLAAEVAQLNLFLKIPLFRDVWKRDRMLFRSEFHGVVDAGMAAAKPT
jgi:hypothetical protein